MIAGLDPAAFWSATGAASLCLYIIFTDKKDKVELKKLLRESEAKRDKDKKELADVTIEATSVLKDMDRAIQKVNENHDRIDQVLQLILGKIQSV